MFCSVSASLYELGEFSKLSSYMSFVPFGPFRLERNTSGKGVLSFFVKFRYEMFMLPPDRP